MWSTIFLSPSSFEAIFFWLKPFWNQYRHKIMLTIVASEILTGLRDAYRTHAACSRKSVLLSDFRPLRHSSIWSLRPYPALFQPFEPRNFIRDPGVFPFPVRPFLSRRSRLAGDWHKGTPSPCETRVRNASQSARQPRRGQRENEETEFNEFKVTLLRVLRAVHVNVRVRIQKCLSEKAWKKKKKKTSNFRRTFFSRRSVADGNRSGVGTVRTSYQWFWTDTEIKWFIDTVSKKP